MNTPWLDLLPFFVGLFIIVLATLLITQRLFQLKREKYLTAKIHKLTKHSSRFQHLSTNEVEKIAKYHHQHWQILLLWASVVLTVTLLGWIASPWQWLILGLCGYGVFWKLTIHVRRKKIKEGEKAAFPQLIELMINAESAGHNLIETLEFVVEQQHQGPLQGSVAQAIASIQMGESFATAMEKMANLSTLEDMQYLATTLTIHHRAGGDLVAVLKQIHENFREKIKIEKKIKTLTQEPIISAILLGSLPIFVLLMLALVSPDYIAPLFRTTLGQQILACCVILEVIGIFAMKKLMDIR